MTSLADLEPYVQNVIRLFLRRIDEVTERGRLPFDIGNWVQFFVSEDRRTDLDLLSSCESTLSRFQLEMPSRRHFSRESLESKG